MDGMWADLLPVGRDSGTGGYRRHAWTPADLALPGVVRGRGRAARTGPRSSTATATSGRGGGTRTPTARAWSPAATWTRCPTAARSTVRSAWCSAFAAVDLLRAAGHRPARPLAVARFSDEEGARFGIACAGSRLLTGALDADRARGLTDGDGTTLAEAMRAAGHDPAHLGRDDEALRRIGTFVELHVEQGRALVDRTPPVGVGPRIWPHGRWRLDLAGEANHAGTTRLADRRRPDARLAAAVLAAREPADRTDALATVGRVAVQPERHERDPVAGAGLAGRARR